MKTSNFKHALLGVLLFMPFFLHANVILQNNELINPKAANKIELLGEELKSKTGVNAYIVAVARLHDKSLFEFEKNITSTLQAPYVLLAISALDKQVDIQASPQVADKFDKEAILSPYPWSGSIIPILAGKKGEDKISAAMLNGYADIVERIADSYGVSLENALGNSNRIVLDLIRAFFYGVILICAGIILFYKIKRKIHAKNQ